MSPSPSWAELFPWLYSQFFVHLPIPSKDCNGKIVCVTGSNVGLGKEAVRHFVRLNAKKVIIACRTVSKGEEAKRDIEQTENSHGVVEVWHLDLTDYESVKSFAKRLDGLPRLDIMVENAGIYTNVYKEVAGNESTITVNVVSTFLLALLVLPILVRTAQAHSTRPTLTIVASEVHGWTSFPERHASSIFTALNDKTKSHMDDRYPVSKLLDVMNTREICNELPDDYPVTINTVTPGMCRSTLIREKSGPFLALLIKIVARTTEAGSRALVHAGLAGKESHGQYLVDCRVTPTSPFVRSDEGRATQTRVWRELSHMLEKIQPGVLNNLPSAGQRKL